MIECTQQGCSREATRVLVTYNHKVVGGELVFCEQHAFENGREKCPCCDQYGVELDDPSGGKIELLPTYGAGTLDSAGCCAEHP